VKKGKLFIISGPSGVGKGTVIDGILTDQELGLCECKTVTSRHQRGGKSDAQYHFVTADQFEKAINAKEMLEYNLYDGNYYGTSKKILYEFLEAGKNAILEVDINGGIAVKSQIPTAKTIFVHAKLTDIEKRIRDRGENTEEEIQDRLTTARSELAMKDRYDYQVENIEGRPEEAIEEVKKIIRKNIS
jgi:guanylate kinase